MTVEPGTLLHSRYRIVRQIGAGGMGAVFEAIDTRLQNTVAVKQTTVSNPIGERAFEREAKTLAGLRHPALPVVMDYFTDAGGQFLVMQFIDGDDLSRVLRRQNAPCSPDDVLAWALSILEALDYLHSHEPPVIHRDIKPANLRRTPRGEIVLLDFGLAKTRAADETRLATDHSVYGYTPHYAPPEQVEGRITDTRSDLYSLGATLYHLTVGVAPRRAADRSAAVRQGLPDPLVAPHLIDGRIGEPFGLAVVRALQLDPERRFASAAEMRAALLDIDGARASRPAPSPAAGNRRIDAAMPSITEVGRQTDLIVQVRFAESPLLGIEDWPTRRRPERIEQGSDSMRVSYPVNPDTGAFMPARMLIKLVAPDFVVGGEAERLIEVPPDEYSKRLAFLLTPRRPGFCRVNVEVFGADAVYLGIIPVEVEAHAGADVIAAPELRVANLVLEVVARHLEERAASERRASDALAGLPMAPLDARHSVVPPRSIEAASPRIRRAVRRGLVYVPVGVIALGTAMFFWQSAARPAPPADVTSPVSTAQQEQTPPAPTKALVRSSAVPLPLPGPPASSISSRPAPEFAAPSPSPTPTASPATTIPSPPAGLPPSTPPLPSPVAGADDQATIRALLNSFAKGYSKKDVKAIARVWPAAPVDQLKSAFASYQSITMIPTVVSIRIDGDTATVAIALFTVATALGGQPDLHDMHQASWSLRKSGGRWIIVGRQ